MDRAAIQRLLDAARQLTHHRDFVIIGSLSVLGCDLTPPDDMLMSVDVDLYPRDDPGRAGEIAAALGIGSDFEQATGYYADAVSPHLPTLPEGWQARLIQVAFDSGVTAWFLDPNDAAISKYARNEPRDREWIRAGLAAGILSLPTLNYRARETMFLGDEGLTTKTALAEDAAWLATHQRKPPHG
jgi:hypothetical protein